jgi:hypothetical protein
MNWSLSRGILGYFSHPGISNETITHDAFILKILHLSSDPHKLLVPRLVVLKPLHLLFLVALGFEIRA